MRKPPRHKSPHPRAPPDQRSGRPAHHTVQQQIPSTQARRCEEQRSPYPLGDRHRQHARRHEGEVRTFARSQKGGRPPTQTRSPCCGRRRVPTAAARWPSCARDQDTRTSDPGALSASDQSSIGNRKGASCRSRRLLARGFNLRKDAISLRCAICSEGLRSSRSTVADFSEARDGLCARVGADLPKGVLEMRAYRAGGDEELRCDLAVGQSRHGRGRGS